MSRIRMPKLILREGKVNYEISSTCHALSDEAFLQRPAHFAGLMAVAAGRCRFDEDKQAQQFPYFQVCVLAYGGTVAPLYSISRPIRRHQSLRTVFQPRHRSEERRVGKECR